MIELRNNFTQAHPGIPFGKSTMIGMDSVVSANFVKSTLPQSTNYQRDGYTNRGNSGFRDKVQNNTNTTTNI